jgi:hypothetical protein
MGRRNLSPDQFAMVADGVRETRSAIAKKVSETNLLQGQKKPTECAETPHSGAVNKAQKKVKPTPNRTATAVAKEYKLPERKVRLAQEVTKADPELAERAPNPPFYRPITKKT